MPGGKGLWGLEDENLELTAVHLGSLIITVAVVIGCGIYFARQVKTAEGFSLNGRSTGVAMLAGTISGTAIGGSSTIGTAQVAFISGLSAWWFTLGTGIAFILMGIFYAKPLRGSALETIAQYLVLNYGKTAGPLTSLISSLGILFSVVASGLAGIQMISALFHISAWQSSLIIMVLVVAYVIFGGLKGAGVSGMLKLAIIWVTLFAAGFSACTSLVAMPNAAQIFPTYPWFSLFGNGFSQAMANLFSVIVGVVCTQSYVQAIYSATDSRTAMFGTFAAALVTIPVGLPSVAVGMFMHVHYPDILPILALPMYLLNYLPAWLGGIGIAGLLLSVVGSIAGLVLGIGTMISRDICSDLWGIVNNRTILWVNRTTVLCVTFLAFVIALSNLQSIVLEWNYLSMALRGAGIFLPLTWAIFRPGTLRRGWVISSMLFSTLAAITGTTVFSLNINPLFIGIIVSFVLIGVGAVLPVEKPVEQTAEQTND